MSFRSGRLRRLAEERIFLKNNPLPPLFFRHGVSSATRRGGNPPECGKEESEGFPTSGNDKNRFRKNHFFNGIMKRA
jgi:hypothetical protein